MATSADKLIGGSTQSFTGDLYFPNTAVTFQGNSTASACTRLIALTITLNGNSTFQSNCAGLNVASIVGNQTFLAE